MDKVHAKAQGSQPGHTLKPVVGPLSMRDALVVVGGVLVLVGSLVPIPWTRAVAVNMWIFPGLPFHLFVSLLLPLLVAAGFLWRRFTGRTRVRIASLSLDQAGSVVAIFAAAYFFNSYVASMSPAYLLGLLGALAMITGTTLATYLGVFRGDFVPGGDSLLGSDVYPVAVPVKVPAVPAAGSAAESEGFGASSAGTASTGRPGTPLTGKPEARRGTPAAAASVAGAAAGAGGAAAAAAPAQESSSAAAQRGEPVADVPATEAKGAGQAGPASANVEAPHAGKAGTTESTSGEDRAVGRQDASPSDTAAVKGHPDQADAAHPLSEWKSVSEAESAPETETEPEPGSAAEPRTAAEAAYAGTASSTTEAKDQGTSPGSADGESPRPEESPTTADAAAPGVDRAGDADAEAKSGPDPKPAAGETPAAEVDGAPAPESAAKDSAHPATMATPRAGADVSATAALSRADIAAHQAAAERARTEAESSFGAKAEVHGHDEEAASFWFALNHPRPVFHPANGTKLSTLNPGTWILCLEDRGTEYLINLADGRPAVLRNLDDLQFPEN